MLPAAPELASAAASRAPLAVRIARWVGARVDSPLYPAATAVSSAADAFIPIAPANTLLVATILARPARWRVAPLWFAAGTTVGAVAFAALVAQVGPALIGGAMPEIDPRVDAWIDTYGAFAAFGLACVPLSMRTATAALALAGIPLPELALAIGAGRLISFCVVSTVARFAPEPLRRFGPVRRILDAVGPAAPVRTDAQAA